jgi:hypothetical protein
MLRWLETLILLLFLTPTPRLTLQNGYFSQARVSKDGLKTLQSLLSQPELDGCVFVAIHIAEGGIVDAFQPPSTTTAQLGIAVPDSRDFQHEIPRIEMQNFCTRSPRKVLKALKQCVKELIKLIKLINY